MTIRIKKVNIENYKCFNGMFSLGLNEGVNILVGNNEAGKSTILEAIHLALTGVINGRYLRNELSQYLFNNDVVKQYVASLQSGPAEAPPHILIEVFFEGEPYPLFDGNGNSGRTQECGVSFKIEFDPQYQDEYTVLVASNSIKTIPVEYYKVTWMSCARRSITSRSIPLKSVLIDSASNRSQNGSDIYISRIIRNDLDDSDRVGMSQAYRKMKETFMAEDAIKVINDKIKSKVSDKDLKVSVDLSTQNSWEAVLMTFLEDTPFHQIGKGEQCIIKTNLALGHQRSQDANLILIEEPENHLSHTKLNQLMQTIQDSCEGKQIIISTHNSFVANKLGLEKLILLKNPNVGRLDELTVETYNFFKKLPGYQTLRLLLCRKAVLVEGDSDELIFQKAYMNANEGKLPVQDGIDVISVKLTFKRFLAIAQLLGQPVAVITDNDGNYANNITSKYSDFNDVTCIKICADNRDELRTLEPQFVDANSSQLSILRNAIDIDSESYASAEQITGYMLNNKTKWALNVFESSETLTYPRYILEAVRWCNE